MNSTYSEGTWRWLWWWSRYPFPSPHYCTINYYWYLYLYLYWYYYWHWYYALVLLITTKQIIVITRRVRRIFSSLFTCHSDLVLLLLLHLPPPSAVSILFVFVFFFVLLLPPMILLSPLRIVESILNWIRTHLFCRPHFLFHVMVTILAYHVVQYCYRSLLYSDGSVLSSVKAQ